MDSKKTALDNWQRGLTLSLLAACCIAAVLMSVTSIKMQYIVVPIIALVLISTAVSSVQFFTLDRDQDYAGYSRPGVSDKMLIAYSIIGGLANAYIALIWARPLLGQFAGVGFFVGNVRYSGLIGAAALAAYVAMTAYRYLRPPRLTLLVLMLLAILIPLGPVLIALGYTGSVGQNYRRKFIVNFTAVFMVATSVVIAYYFAGMRKDDYRGLQSVETISIEQSLVQTATLPALVRSGENEAPVGACVDLLGSRSNPSLAVGACDKAAYRVIQRVETPRQCPADVDDKFYLNPPSGQWTACLDYAWRHDDCLSITRGASATRVACDDRSRTGRERPTRLINNSVSAADCPSGGFAHPVRRFTVCTETQK
ncbi:Uncharacterised protein [Mycobacteroides abscessus subsp. bolletii]|uniref:LppU/SCO3897 family protein n=1 Tax=Mycobacteroides abscessus TaxID=36809 RepID=UPI0009D363CF|nr:hypothetical protein [Mycobacteroides abscessus]SKS41742.1 Uncharacterised protein [Mycobacteroides abscessus subsp. bolletii]SKS85164.1 Uncharacterised protein [Mycobacteroides abscessus subsp. bolletii]